MPSENASAVPEVVCAGMITPARVLVVDEMPSWNTGAVWTRGAEFISDDAAIVAGLLAGWGVPVELAGTALGDDRAGRRAIAALRDMGVAGKFVHRADVETPFEVNVSDSKGGRTYFWRRDADILATLADADLSSVPTAKLLYADWYDAPHNLPALRAAADCGVPTMLNIEHAHGDPEAMALLAEPLSKAAIVQAVTDAAQLGGDALGVADSLTRGGADVALITLAEGGELVERAGFDLHLTEDALIYLKQPCSQDDVRGRFWLSVHPSDAADLPENRRELGHESRNFSFEPPHGVVFNGKCMATRQLPDYEIAKIETGQWIPGGEQLWSAVVEVGED